MGQERRVEDAPDVAIVVNTFNQTRYLESALLSCVDQLVAPREIVVVDDGSSDDPGAVVGRFEQVRLIRQPNSGLAASRNTGWRATDCAYVVFLDADDRLTRRALKSGLECLERNPDAWMAYGAHRHVSESGEPISPVLFRSLGSAPLVNLLRGGNLIAMHGAVIYRREALAALGGFDQALPVCEDLDLYLRVAEHGRIASHGALVAEYRQHDDNMSRDKSLMLDTALRVADNCARRVGSTEAIEAAAAGASLLRRTLYPMIFKKVVSGMFRKGWNREQAGVALNAARAEPVGIATQSLKRAAKGAIGRLPRPLGRFLGRYYRPPLGSIAFGDLGDTKPVGGNYGFDRGTPVDRAYIERFLGESAGRVRGRVLEIGDDAYTRRFGGANVSRSDVLHYRAGNPKATFAGDLADPAVLPPQAFDCIILTQTLQLCFDLPAIVRNLYAALADGGVLLATVPGTTSIQPGEYPGAPWLWAFTDEGLRRLLEIAFERDLVRTETYGNVLAATAFLQGLAQEEIAAEKLEHKDPRFPVIVAAAAQRRPAI
jgi:glycosyltransferase involved in cell wall biosynthesis